MAANRRRQLRTLVANRLRAANTRAGAQVFTGRIYPVTEREMELGGVLVVHTGEEKSSIPEAYPGSLYQGTVSRTIDLIVDLFAPAAELELVDGAEVLQRDCYALVDELSEQVEGALETYKPPGFDSGTLQLEKTTPGIDEQETAGLPVMKIVMLYKLTYQTPYRECSDPLVDNDNENIYRRGLYPGGQVIEGCPADHTGSACPLPDADVIPQADLTDTGAYPYGNQA